MKDKYLTDRRDPAVKQLERQGLIDLAVSVNAPLETLRELVPESDGRQNSRIRDRRLISSRQKRRRLVSGILIAFVLSQMPTHAFTKRDILDGLRRWEHGSYCQGLFRRGGLWETVAFFSGC